jgi:DNA modification methylase
MQVVFISAALNLKRKFIEIEIEIEIEIDPQRFEVAKANLSKTVT